MERTARPAGVAPAITEQSFWDDAFAIAQETRCGSDEIVAERWDRMVQQYPQAWIQWLMDQVGGLTDQGVVRRLYASQADVGRIADSMVRQIPDEVLRAIATHLARVVPELDGIELAVEDVAVELERELEGDLREGMEGTRHPGNLLDRLARSLALRHRTVGRTATRVLRLLTRTAGDTSNCAGLVIRNRDGAVLLVRRAPDDTRPGQWEFPGGHIRDGESAVQGAARECREELGRLPKRIRYVLSLESPIPDGTYTNVFVQTDDEAYEPDLNSEHDAWGWFTADDLPDDVNPGCLKALENGPFDIGLDHQCVSTLQIDDLADYLLADWSDAGPKDEGAVGMAIRLLQSAQEPSEEDVTWH